MNDKIRARFEAWYAISYPDEWGSVACRLQRDQTVNEIYYLAKVQMAWNAYKACAESMQADKDKLEVMLEASRLAADSILKDWHKSKVANDKLEARVKELQIYITDHCYHDESYDEIISGGKTK